MAMATGAAAAMGAATEMSNPIYLALDVPQIEPAKALVNDEAWYRDTYIPTVGKPTISPCETEVDCELPNVRRAHAVVRGRSMRWQGYCGSAGCRAWVFPKLPRS